MDRGRRWIGERAHGRVLEVGIGTGLSMVHYARSVDLVGVDITAAMLNIARRRAHDLGRHADLGVADAAGLAFADSSFDCVVFTYSLCSIPNPSQALAEARRLLRDGGSLLTAEHVRSTNHGVRVLQLVLNPFFVLMEADSLLRDPLGAINHLGFAVDEVERWACGVTQCIRATNRKAAAVQRPSAGRAAGAGE